ncbi:MAG: hypothetical protein QF830_08760 [Rhodospirillales bacterium]|jgi:hypothetical protein|nr:hypothetical protein [Rhodospirillales bacterium]MDP6884213.1 hypothetical protein [Rhodospirillales bacterium]
MVKNMDKDGDGKIDRDEWTGHAKFYDKIDTDRDDRLTLAELAVHVASLADSGGGKGKAQKSKDKNPKTMIKNLDTDGDGLLAPKEWKADKEKFDQFDADRDGRLTVEEITAGFSASKDSKVKLMTAIKAFDKNRDTLLSRDEWTGPAKQFDLVDANQDNQLTVLELATAQVKQMDKDGNGQLSPSETPFPKTKFDILDASGDDLISATEFAVDMGWGQATK